MLMAKIARIRLPVAAVLAVLAAGCGTGSDLGSTTGGTTTATTDTAATVQESGAVERIVMRSLDFSPIAVRAKVGQRVVWHNEDAAPHNVTYISGPRFHSSRPVMDPGASFSIKLTQAGTVRYYCTIHPWMKATIVVSR
jgi:plastocyanin